jgi:hypothetical protein
MTTKTRTLALDKAFSVAKATEWEGDIRVNFLTCARSCRVLARYCEELEKEKEELELEIEARLF